MADLFGTEELGGCTRRLFYDKAGFEADRREDTIGVVQRGVALEAAAADLYESLTGRELLNPTHNYVQEGAPWNRVNIDRTIQPLPEYNGPGVLEIKTMNQWVFGRAKRQGMKSAHILQLQHAMGVTGRKWGAFMALHPDTWDRFYFDVQRDERLIEIIRERTAAFWPQLEKGEPMAEALEPSDARCKGCKFADQCQGSANVFMYGLDAKERSRVLPEAPEFDEWLCDWDEARKSLQESGDRCEELKAKAKDMLGSRDGVQCGSRRIYHTSSDRQIVDSKKLKAAYPDVAAECTKTSKSTTFRVY
jgi:predicted phage-related endonuclease